MAIGTITVAESTGKVPSAPLFVDILSFAGDSAYGAGGSAILAAIKAKIGAGRTVLTVFDVGPNGGYITKWDRTNGKLLVYEGNYDAADGPLQESSTANLSGVTFVVGVLSY